MHLAEYRSHNPEGADRLAEKLDDLLFDYQVYQQNVRNLQWNRRLRPFLDFGPKVQLLDQVTDQNTQAVAEHLIQLGYSPQASAPNSLMLSTSRVAPLPEVENADEALLGLIEMSKQLLETVHEVWYLAQELKEPNTLGLMTKLATQLKFGIHVFQASRLAMNN